MATHHGAWLAASLLVIGGLIAVPADARITKLVIDKTVSPAFGGKSFGSVGPYETLAGTAYGELDPQAPSNAVITDIGLAPRNARGMVEYSMDVLIAKPVDMAHGNHTLLYDVVNRGRPSVPAMNIGGTASDVGDGFLEQQGYTLAYSGWEGDITSGIRIKLPVARNPDGSDITGRVRSEYILNAPAAAVDVTASPAYEATGTSNDGAVLTRRVRQGDARETIPADQWAFADCTKDKPFPGTPNDKRLCLAGGFDTDHIYELIYTAKNPTVAGIGLAATRDFITFLRDRQPAEADLVNPLGDGVASAIIFGSSQSGRFVRSFIQLGFNEDEAHRRVADGAIPHKASNRGPFNVRFAQPTRLSGTQHTERDYPGQESPQSWDVSDDPLAGIKAGQLDRCRRSDTCPKITATVTDTEYWQAMMALNTTDAKGQHDLAIPPEVRIYFFAGTQHGGGDPLAQPPSVAPKLPANCQLPNNTNPFIPAQRALLVALRNWVVEGAEPPPSRFPLLQDGGLVPLDAIKIPYVPAQHFTLAGMATIRRHLDRGPGFDETDASGVMTEPPVQGATYAALMPAVDADGNDIAGLRDTSMEVPLGTYSGWNVRKAGFSEGDSCDLTGAFIPFFRTKAERLAAGDTRPSLEERYLTHGTYVGKVTAAANRLVDERFLLRADADLIINQAKEAAIP
jgi:hypothetical protein